MSSADDTLLRMLQSAGRAGGGQWITTNTGQFYAIYDGEFAETLDVEQTSPALTCRTVDVQSRELEKDVVLDVVTDRGREQLRIRRFEPDGTGITVIRLKR